MGWSPQETINLLVAYRREHGEGFVSDLDYYGRLIDQTESSEEKNPSPDPTEELSEVLGLPLNRLLKFKKKNSVEYVLELEDGSRHELGKIQNLDSQKKFRRKIMNLTGHVIANEDGSEYSREEWMRVRQLFMNAAEETTGKEQRPKSEELLSWLQGFFAKYDIPRLMTEREKKKRITQQIPFRTKEKLFFSSERFVKYLKRTHDESFSTTSIARYYYHPLGMERERFIFRHPKDGDDVHRSCWNAASIYMMNDLLQVEDGSGKSVV